MNPNFLLKLIFIILILAAVGLMLVLVLSYKKILRTGSREQNSTPRSSVIPQPDVLNTPYEDTTDSFPEVVTLLRPKYMDQAEAAENTVDNALRQLQESRYFVFKDLIIPSSSRNLGLTQIDHVLVSRMGIFCIETKSTKGNIYGFSRDEYWQQYLGKNPYKFNSPFRQNAHHVSSIEMLLSNEVKAPVHSYIAFPNAHKVVVDQRVEDMSPVGIISKIARHTQVVYNASEVERIAKILAHAGTLREQLRERHISEVNAYINAKVSPTLKLS
jgi:hypothetical protein